MWAADVLFWIIRLKYVLQKLAREVWIRLPFGVPTRGQALLVQVLDLPEKLFRVGRSNLFYPTDNDDEKKVL